MYKIVLAVNDDQATPMKGLVDAVRSLPGTADELSVTIVTVFEEFEVVDEGAHINSSEFYEQMEVPDRIRGVGDRLEKANISASVRLEHGDPAEEILRVATDSEADLIVIGGRKRTPVGKAVFGSVTQSTLLNADRPVLVVTEP